MRRSGRNGRMTNLDMKTSMVGVLVRRARESDKLPGLMATAVMLPRLYCDWLLDRFQKLIRADERDTHVLELQVSIQSIHPHDNRQLRVCISLKSMTKVFIGFL